jgi:hypothetical protein
MIPLAEVGEALRTVRAWEIEPRKRGDFHAALGSSYRGAIGLELENGAEMERPSSTPRLLGVVLAPPTIQREAPHRVLTCFGQQ